MKEYKTAKDKIPGRPGRFYPGYEDYSAEGRAAIKAFNAEGAPVNHRDSKKQYDSALDKAMDARYQARLETNRAGSQTGKK